MENNRRQFLTGIGTAAAAAISGGTIIGRTASAAALPPSQPTFERGISSKKNLFFEIGGVSAGRVLSAIGGDAIGQVVEVGPTSDGVMKKTIGDVLFDELVLEFGIGSKAELYDLIGDLFTRKPQVVAGAVVFAPPGTNLLFRREFFGAVITEFAIPALDRSAKGSSLFTVKFAPESTEDKDPTPGPYPFADLPLAKGFSSSSFRLSIGDLNTKNVIRIDSMIVKQEISGTGDRGELLVGPLQVPDLCIYLSELSAEPYYAFFKSFVIDGKHDDAHEITGQLELLNPVTQGVLFTFAFLNVGIYRIERIEGGLVKVSLYCERMTFATSAGAVG